MFRNALALWLLAAAASAQDTDRDDSSGFHIREILLSIFQATGGFSWASSTNWVQQGVDVCQWEGVVCYSPDTADSRRAGHIQELNLKNNRLRNTLPSTVFEIPYLESLNVEDNADLIVDLSRIGEAQFLKELDISNTGVTSIDGIGGALNLEILHLTGLNLNGPLPVELFSLTNLEYLYANDNSFSGSLPADIGRLTALRELYIGNSDLTGQLPSELGALNVLAVLALNNNAFGGTLPEVAMNTLTNLKTLALQRDGAVLKGSGISGPIPAFANYPQLTTLYLQSQKFSGSLNPSFLMDCPEGETVDVNLSSNEISGSVPGTLQDKKYLVLNLAGNQITSVPNELVNQGSGICTAIDNWMGGDVLSLGCNAFLCPPGTWAPEGRATRTDSCATCPDNASLWGRTECSSTTTADTNDRQVLVNLYNVLGGRSWKSDDNWLSLDVPVCEWYGISCTNGLVSTINLRNNGLTGSVPQDLFSLVALRTLNLELNSISFSFQGISSATNLQVLNLASTGLSSSTLNEMQELGSLNNLSVLSIDSNSLGGSIPAAIFGLTSLTELNVGHNGFTGSLDTRIGLLTQLQRLLLDGNALTGQVPTQIGNLVTLQELVAGENQFGGTLPTELNRLTNLRSLSMQQVVTSGGIGGPMLSFANLGQLTSLDLGSNQLTGNLPSDLLTNSFNLGAEISIDLSDNRLSGRVPSQWSRFDRLFIDLSGNRIAGIDEVLCQLSDWMGGDVGSFGCDAILCPKGTSNSAGRQSEIDSICTNCSNGGTSFLGAKSCSSQSVDFGTNTGSEASILSDFFAATHGTGWKQNNGWDDSADICSFFGVECDEGGRVSKIDLTDNGLKGSVPSSIFKIPQLTELTLSNNAISIAFDNIADASGLAVLRLDGIDLPTITGLGAAARLSSVSLADNNLNGEISFEIYLLSNLRELNLGYNGFEGRIPNLVGALTSLESLQLYHNQFTGRIPAALGDLSNLQVLNLAENNFEGNIPLELTELTNLRFLSLQREGGILGSSDVGIRQGDSSALGPGLTGPLPSFHKLRFIKELYLGVNSLTGSIPFDFLDGVTDNQAEIQVDLMSNRLTGTLPASLTQFESLSLYVGDNRITDIAGALCTKASWLNGDVGQYQCDGILCPDGTFSSLGRRGPGASSCETCASGTSGYMGSVECLSSSEQQENNERAVLEKMYRQMNGENWLVNTNWMDPDESICTWYGIECRSTSSPTIISIDLENNRLLNSLTIDIWSLPNLQKLNLKTNDIQVSIFGIQNAGSLEYLDLSETGLTSLSGVAGASQLKVLRADSNAMTTFSTEILDMINLETLSLSNNRFPQMVVPDFERLTKLTHLSMQNSGLMGIIPPWISQLSALEYLKLGQNGLMGNLPTALLQLTKLKYLDLSDQESNNGGLGGMLPDFSNHTQLSEIFLQRNSFQGPIPPTLLQSKSTTDLVTLDLRYNELTGAIPTELSRFNEMNLFLAANRFTSLPASLCNTNWNEGNAGTHGCDGILCASGTFNAYGRAIGTLECRACDSPFLTASLGSTTCGSSLEHSALIAFYQSTGGPNWKSQINWLKSDDHCTWEGISCHTEGEFEGLVKAIELEDNNLVGTADLNRVWQFEGLEVLNLQINDIAVSFFNVENAINLQEVQVSETLTSSLLGIGGAQSLQELHITGARLVGPMPFELFELSNLRKLFLSQNQLTGSLPSEIGQLGSLEDLYVFDNSMRGTLPSEIGLLGSLQHLSLGMNDFVGTIPRQINSLNKLEMLSLQKEEDAQPDSMFAVGGLGFSGPVPSLSGLPNVKEVYLGHNSLIGTIPSDFLQGVVDKARRVVVDLSYNNIDGPIPASFANFGDLQLELARNSITEIPDRVCAKTSWFNGEVANGCDAILCFPGTYNEYGRRTDSKTICRPCTYPGSAVDYGAVNCGPVFADSMTDQEILMELYDATGGSEWANSAGWNSDSVSFCDWFGVTCEAGSDFGQASVTEIALMENNLNGIIPSIIFHLPEVRKLDVRNNAVTIGLNAAFQAENLEELYLDRTRVSTLDGIGQVLSLRVLHLHKNSFGGQEIPDELFDLTSLEDLNLSDSMFGGTLSSKVGQLVNLKRFSLVGNAVTGQIPAEIGNLIAVEDLDLSGNNWYGTLPETISSLASLRRFNLNNNQVNNVGITGQLRPFATMPNLSELNLSNNQFTGLIPDSFLSGIVDKTVPVVVFLDGNHLGGIVPSSLAALQQVNIYLQNNLISGFGTGICQQFQWMDGNVARYGCDAILCPAGEYSPDGRQVSDSTACKSCPDLQGTPTLGSSLCVSAQKQIEKDILLSLFQSTTGVNWKNSDGWADDDVDICNWYGIKCKEGATVESILLGSNGLVGTVPSDVYELPSLKFLWLYSNHIDLSFAGIEQATSLTSLLLDATKIKSLDGIGAGHSLVDIDVRFNNLKGSLPMELANLANLETFTCSHNALSGSIPELSALRKLKTLRMGSNGFIGELPSFANHPSLVNIDLSDNGLGGSVPEDLLAAVPESQELFLDLSGNRITGIVPGELSRFAQMTILLRDNRISGINPNLCEQTLWNGGDVQEFQCNAILCPKGTVSSAGRASDGVSCRSCSKNKYLGASTCGNGSSASSRFLASLGVLAGAAIATTGILLI